MKKYIILVTVVLLIGAVALPLLFKFNNKKESVKAQKVEQNNPAEFDPGPHADQATMNLDSYEAVQFWKKKMNARLDNIKKIYEKADWTDALHKARFFNNLDASQKAFEAYLKAQVELQYPKAEEDEWWGSGIPPCINLIYTKHYKNRYNELGLWEKGTPDGEMCGGSALTAYEMSEMGVFKK
jgi:hypothetical protein